MYHHGQSWARRGHMERQVTLVPPTQSQVDLLAMCHGLSSRLLTGRVGSYRVGYGTPFVSRRHPLSGICNENFSRMISSKALEIEVFKRGDRGLGGEAKLEAHLRKPRVKSEWVASRWNDLKFCRLMAMAVCRETHFSLYLFLDIGPDGLQRRDA